jgi:hypothetical protein
MQSGTKPIFIKNNIVILFSLIWPLFLKEASCRELSCLGPIPYNKWHVTAYGTFFPLSACVCFFSSLRTYFNFEFAPYLKTEAWQIPLKHFGKPGLSLFSKRERTFPIISLSVHQNKNVSDELHRRMLSSPSSFSLQNTGSLPVPTSAKHQNAIT